MRTSDSCWAYQFVLKFDRSQILIRGATSSSSNGAGMRDQSTGATSLIVENSIFEGNQEGILTGGSNNQETVQILNSQFINNGNSSGGSTTCALCR
jgi:hypothetical protein